MLKVFIVLICLLVCILLLYDNGNHPRFMINQSFDYELNFLLGEWDGPNPSFSELSLGENISVAPNSNFTIPLYLSSDELVGGFHFNISMDPALNFESIESTFDCFTANYNTVQDEIIVIIFSLEGCAFPAQYIS